nr:inositol oxygenase family protein [Rhabdothermincola salaria]
MLETHGADPYDEAVSQLDHALQCAALARRDHAADALVVAALVHDIGHLLVVAQGDGFRPGLDDHHERTGAAWLGDLFPVSVTAPVAAHVEAKRYLAGVEPGYHASLSEGSRHSLALQGGPMTRREAATFRALPCAADAVALRRWDDRGKVDDLDVAALTTHRALLDRVARTTSP